MTTNHLQVYGLMILTHFTLCKQQFDSGKLIMGFGPSASGKTFWAKTIIKLLSEHSQLKFPHEFLSIDGGLQRETSLVYQIIKNVIKEVHGSGVRNLVSPSFFSSTSIFSSDTVKKNLKNYLKHQNNVYIYPNLYVPETLGGCALKLHCSSVYKDYISITNDQNWIALYIWQHKDTCNLPDHLKCKSVVTSGTTRETLEGKNTVLKHTRLQNTMEIKNYSEKTGSTYQIRIHNSGGAYTHIHNKKTFNASIVEFDKNLYTMFQKTKQQLQKNIIV